MVWLTIQTVHPKDLLVFTMRISAKPIHRKCMMKITPPPKDHFLTKAKFTKLVENAVKERRLSYMDAILDVCDNIADIEVENVNKYIAPSIKEKVEAEAQRLNFLPRGNTLPVD